MSGFLGNYVKSELDCSCVDIEDFGGQPGNENNDVPLYDQYNRGLTLCEDGMERKNLATEAGKRDKSQRVGLTGYIPSMEQSGQYPGSSPNAGKLLLALGKPSENMYRQSLARRGLTA